MDQPCQKHMHLALHAAMLALASTLTCTCRSPNQNVLIQVVMDFCKSWMEKAMKGYDDTPCTCEGTTIRAASTFRMGASWASASRDVANLNDLVDFPEY